MKRYIARLLFKYFEGEIMDILGAESLDDAKDVALKAGYTEDDWQDYYFEKQNEGLSESYRLGQQEAFLDGYWKGKSEL